MERREGGAWGNNILIKYKLPWRVVGQAKPSTPPANSCGIQPQDTEIVILKNKSVMLCLDQDPYGWIHTILGLLYPHHYHIVEYPGGKKLSHINPSINQFIFISELKWPVYIFAFGMYKSKQVKQYSNYLCAIPGPTFAQCT